MRDTTLKAHGVWSDTRMHALRLLFGAILWMFLPHSSFAAGRVFFDDFESGNTALWTKDNYRDMCTVVSVPVDRRSGAVRGHRMVQCNWNGTVAWNDPKSFEGLVLPMWPYQKEFLVRFWIRTDGNMDRPFYGPKYFRIGGDGGSFGGLDTGQGKQTAAFHGPEGQIGTTFWGGDTKASDGNWHQVAIYIRNGTADGDVRIWEDGVKIWETKNVNVTQSKGTWSPFHVSSNWSGAENCCDHDATNHMYWDDFEIYSDAATGGVGALSDNTIQIGQQPAPPRGVIVQ